MGQPSDAIEKALAHSIKGIKGVYNRAEYAEERRRILRLWADFVEAQINEGSESHHREVRCCRLTPPHCINKQLRPYNDPQ